MTVCAGIMVCHDCVCRDHGMSWLCVLGLWYVMTVCAGIKRPHDEGDEDMAAQSMKRSRDEGPQIELRCLIQSKVPFAYLHPTKPPLVPVGSSDSYF